MSSRCFARTMVLAALLGAAWLSPASAAVWFSDNFDAYTSGDLSGQAGWAGTAGAVRVQASLAQSGKAAEADFISWGAGSVSHAVSAGPGYHYVDVDVAMDTQAPVKGENLGYLKLFGGNGKEITRIYFAHQQLKVLLGPANPTVVLDDVAARSWHHVRLGVDLLAGTMDVWIDGRQALTGAATYQPASSVASIEFGEWAGLAGRFTKSECCIDNLVCTAVQETTADRVVSPIAPWAGWEHGNAAYPCVIFDSTTGLYTMYYSGSYTCDVNESLWDQWATGYATSTDGANWTKPKDNYEPILYARKLLEGDLLDPETQSATFDSIMAFGPCVIKDGATYRMWYTGWNGDSVHDSAGITTRIDFRIGCAISADGINWTKQAGTAGAGSVLGLGQPGQPDSLAAANPHVLKEGDTYRMWYEGFDGSTWRILHATSADGMNWTRQGTALSPGPSGSLDVLGARNPVVITRGGHYEMWYQGRGASPPNYHILRATSPDGIVWTKIPGQVSLHPDYPVSGEERILVDSILERPDGSLQVFFSKEITDYETLTHGTVRTRRFHIYREVVNL